MFVLSPRKPHNSIPYSNSYYKRYNSNCWSHRPGKVKAPSWSKLSVEFSDTNKLQWELDCSHKRTVNTVWHKINFQHKAHVLCFIDTSLGLYKTVLFIVSGQLNTFWHQ